MLTAKFSESSPGVESADDDVICISIRTIYSAGYLIKTQVNISYYYVQVVAKKSLY